MMPATLNASHGQFMMGHYWWGGDLSYWETASGVPSWRASTDIFTMMMWPTVHRIHYPLGIVRKGQRHFVERESWALCGVATREHPGEDLGAAADAVPGCRLLGIGADTPVAHPPTHHQGATAGNLYPLEPIPCPSSPWQLMFQPTPGPAARVGEWPDPPWTMRRHGRMISRPHTPQCAG